MNVIYDKKILNNTIIISNFKVWKCKLIRSVPINRYYINMYYYREIVYTKPAFWGAYYLEKSCPWNVQVLDNQLQLTDEQIRLLNQYDANLPDMLIKSLKYWLFI